ncbi:hypothetical protein CAPTEDRAFT_120337 [Capitella teleta]|uniref:RING-type domain-containing protein n=1 Tax=Capitella teleta TaxID=283909 RepID=R7U8K4_CAPTE|nr:hypothetical protein CAPTEDRAFT_120337 [Capitella teleta]|eukprot:ELT99440.1 hypothetical protein CAPTEDRAFT_120337 [Capitella teleta]
MNIETFRIASFEQWPSDAGARPLALAAAGFYHSGGPNSCEVTCFSCDLSVSQWEPHQDPLAVHRQLAPHCPFLSGKTGAASQPSSPPLDAATGNNSLTNTRLSFGSFHSEWATNVSHNKRSVYMQDDGTGDIRTRPNIGFLDRMRSEEERTATYEDWTYGQCQSANALAKAGFFFTGVQDRTQCAFCRGVLHRWESTDNPWEEHKKYFPSCPFVLGREVNNVSGGPPSNVRMGILTDEEERTATYEDWTYGHRQSANALAEAGFFFTGVQDRIQCAFCRGVLHSWESTDNPWEEHKKHFPSCPFVLGRQIDQKKKAPETIMTAAIVEAHDLNSGELRVWYNMPLIYFKTDERRHVKRKRVNEHIFCEVCMHRDCNVVFLPCRHLVCCTLCTDGLKRCPICHTRIKRIVSVFVFDE